MGLWGRLMNAGRAAVSAFNEKSLIPLENSDWDKYAARQFRYYHSETYYNNTVYTSLVAYAAAMKSKKKLYKHIRGVYNPVERLVETYVSKCYGGALDMEHLSTGPIPILQADDRLRDAIRQLWIWSNWGTQKSLYVRHGAKLGDVVLKVVDDRASQKVRLEVLHPGKIKDVELDEVGNVKRVVIEYEVLEERVGGIGRSTRVQDKTYTYTETIDQEWFKTFKNGEAFAFFQDANGEPVSQWPNEYGFVPLVIAKHRDVGLIWGKNAFQGAVMSKIDELNDAASLLNDQIRKAVNVMWYFAGVQKADDLTTGADDKDQIPAIYGPADSQPHPLVGDINIADAGQNVQAMLAEVERDTPELVLHRIRESGNLTAPGVKAAYSDAIDRIDEARGNYNDALIRATQMAVSIGGFNRYTNFESFTLDSYARGDLAFYIGERPVIEDGLSTLERVQFLIQSGAPQAAVWAALDVPEDTILEWQAQAQAQAMLTEAHIQQQIALLSAQNQPQIGGGDELNA